METDIEILMGRLEPRLQALHNITHHGHDMYLGLPTSHTVEYDTSTQAQITYQHILAEARHQLDDLADVRFLDIKNLKVWLLEKENIVIRFKKTDGQGLSRNYPTGQARDYEAGREIPGLPQAPTRLTVGYMLDDTGLEIERTQISLPNGRKTMWCAAIIGTLGEEDEMTYGWEDVTKQAQLY